MTSFLLLGFLIGLRHALDPDHVAAVAALATRARSTRACALQGAIWGLGHTVTVLLLGGACVALGTVIPEPVERASEAVVGVMLLLLGADVLWRLTKPTPESTAAATERGERPPWRAFVVGSIHGMAGSAALVLLAARSDHGVAAGLGYLALFGVGSILGMTALTACLAAPLLKTGRSAGRWIHAAAAFGSIAVGALLIYGNWTS